MCLKNSVFFNYFKRKEKSKLTLSNIIIVSHVSVVLSGKINGRHSFRKVPIIISYLNNNSYLLVFRDICNST